MRGYINHESQLAAMTKAAKQHNKDIAADVLDNVERLATLGISGLTMRKLADDPIFDMYTRIVNYMLADRVTFKTVLQNGLADCGLGCSQPFKDAPAIVFSPKDRTKVRVFVNLPFASLTEQPVYWARASLLSQAVPFIKAYYADLADDKKKLAWASIVRAKKRMLKYEEMDISRAIARFMPGITSEMSSSQARDLATVMAEYDIPTKLEYADDNPSDYYEMYKNGPDSCMKDNGSRPFSWMAKLSKPVHPTSMFAYNPYVKGCFIKRGGKVVGRTFLYSLDFFTAGKTKGWAFGRVYGSTDKFTRIFMAAMQEAGYKDMRNASVEGLDMSRRYSFTVSPITVTDNDEIAKEGTIAVGSYMYVPYLDDHPRGANVEYDPDANAFVVSFSSTKEENCVFGSQHGFLPSSAFMENLCACCGTKINMGQGYTAASDGKLFHGDSCANAAGYIKALIGSGGATVFVPPDTPGLVQDAIDGRYYMPSALGPLNVMPLLASLNEVTEDTDRFTRHGCVVKIDKKFYRLVEHLARALNVSRTTASGQGFDYAVLKLAVPYVNISTVRTVILEEDHTHIDGKTIREIEQVAA